jgi:hypothetical protein
MICFPSPPAPFFTKIILRNPEIFAFSLLAKNARNFQYSTCTNAYPPPKFNNILMIKKILWLLLLKTLAVKWSELPTPFFLPIDPSFLPFFSHFKSVHTTTLVKKKNISSYIGDFRRDLGQSHI